MTTKYHTRMGDGRLVEMTKEELKNDIEEGANKAAEKSRVPDLTEDDKEHLLEIFTTKERMVCIEREDAIVLSTDNAATSIFGNYSEFGGVGVPTNYLISNIMLERAIGNDILMYGFLGGNYKEAHLMATQITMELEAILTNTINPQLYISMPNFGAYYKPDGAFDNVGDLMAEGKIEEGRKVSEEVIPASNKAIKFMADTVNKIGVDCLNLDTTGAAGDAEFLSVLQSTEVVKKTTDMSVMVGMANQFVLGIHGELEYEGKILAGMQPHEQVKVVQKAGADIFGPVVNTNTKKSTAWNVAKTIAMTKECVKVSDIPIHPNLGMGVGGAPMCEITPVDAVSRAAKAMVEVAGADGI